MSSIGSSITRKYMCVCFGAPVKIYIRMPSSCCAVGCINRLSKVCNVSFIEYDLRVKREK